ncbi:MAG: tRNA guanosine(34) transglycosylase Tgt [Acidobacteriota bacterium]|nr:tRNA guanosine(34) transglycosylase Tgt [Acidobacteriota bacterium]
MLKQTKSPVSFEVIAQDGQARAGILSTRRGIIETPVFMPVGTAGTVKGIRFEELESKDLDARIILGNTYHLWLRPGVETIRACEGLHRFIGWDRALITDSGGFQVWSLGALRKISEEGTEFRSHVDGSLRFLSPEVSMEVQAALGSDIVMVFDECAPGKATHDEARASLELTARWAKRSRDKFDQLQREGFDMGSVRLPAENSVVPIRNPKSEIRNPKFSAMPALQGELTGAQALFGIVQGAAHRDLRLESLERTVEIGFDGYAIGGLSVGEEKSVMWDLVDEVSLLMPPDRPRYLMGVGTPEDLIAAVARGIDMFDCVLPTRNGRTGQAFTSRGKLNVKNVQWTEDQRPLDESCRCSVCQRHSRAYLRHLHQTGEMLAGILLTHHNLAFFLDTMRRVRQSIRSGDFPKFRREFIERLSASGE